METNLFDFIINHNTITGCKTMTSIVLQNSKICYKLSEVCSLNYASPEPEPVLTHLSAEWTAEWTHSADSPEVKICFDLMPK